MAEYRYHGYTIKRSEYIHANTGKPLYNIEHLKPAGMRPFITSIQAAHEFIRTAEDLGYWIDGAGRTHTIPQR